MWIMKRNPREHIFGAHSSFSCPVVSFCSWLVVILLQLLLVASPKMNMCIGKQKPARPLQRPPQPTLGIAWLSCLWPCSWDAREGKGLVNQWVFSSFENDCFPICSAMWRIIRGSSDAGPVVMWKSSNAFFPFGNDSLVSKANDKWSWWMQSCTLPG